MSFEVAERRSPTSPSLRQALSRARRLPAFGLAAGFTATAGVRLAAASASADWRLRGNRGLVVASSRRVVRSAGAALVASALLVALARGAAGSSWVDVAALSALLLVATAAMLGISRALGDGAERTLVALLAGWIGALITGVGLWSTPLRESPLVSLEALVMLAVLASLGGAITYLLSYTITRLVVAPLTR